MMNGKQAPVVSVVMAAYNEVCSISAAIQSIINQTFTDWEFIIVDDGSSDSTVDIIMQFQKHDSRINLINNKTNIGLAGSLNRGIAVSRGKYIARMDADDFSYSERFRLQVEFLDTYTDISVVGGNVDFVDESGNFIRKSNMPSSPHEVRHAITKTNPLIHPSVMCRREFLQIMGGYDERLRKKQDYDLWLRGCDIGRYANLDDVVMRYTVQSSKPVTTDLYGFYVRCLNAYRRRNYVTGVLWAFITLGINIMRKFGYKQSAYRK